MGSQRRWWAMTRAILILTVMLGLVACDDPEAPISRPKAAPPPTPMSVARAPARPSGPGVVTPAAPSEELQEAASVSQLHALPSLNAKIYSLSGGDPAVNGLVTYLALFAGPAEGWRSYPLGDYAEWRVAEAKAGRIVLAVRQDTAGSDGNIVKRSRHVHAGFAWSDGAPPAAVTVSTTP